MNKKLSKRQMQVIEAIKDGQSNREAAENLLVCEKTIKFHLTRIFKKMNVKNRTELIVKMYQEFPIGEKQKTKSEYFKSSMDVTS